MTVYAITGIPFLGRKRYVIDVYEQEKDAYMAIKEDGYNMYSDLEVQETEFHENYIDNSLDYD